jgi:hypothetical protein
MALFSFFGPFLQSVSEARGAAVQIFQLIDAVCLFLFLLSILNFIYFHHIGK